MGMKVAELYADLGLNTRRFDAGMAGMATSASAGGSAAGMAAGAAVGKGLKSKLGAAVAGVGTMLKGNLALVGAAAGVAAVVGIKKAVSAASDLEESISKTKVVFKGSAQGVLDWSKTSSTAMGMSRNQALEAAGTYGNLMVSLGLSGDKAAGMSTNLIQLAGDMASFNNASPEETLDAIRSGLVGETEPLKRFGVNMNEATLQAQALKMGISDGTKALTPAQKAQAAYALILDQTKTAQGDFARTSGGMANQTRIMKAQLSDLGTSIGAALVPVVSKLLQGLNAAISWLRTNWPAFSAIIKQGVDAVRPVFEEIIATVKSVVDFIRANWGTIGPIVSGIWTTVWTIIKTVLKVISSLIRAVLAVIRGDWSAAWGFVKAAAAAAWRGINAAIRSGMGVLRGIVSGLAGKIKGWIGDMAGALVQTGRDLIQGLINGIRAKIGELATIVSEAASAAKRAFTDLLGISSPSKVFAGYGRNLMEGLAVGITGGAGLPRTALAGVSGAFAVSGTGGGSYGTGRVVIEEHHHVHLPGGSVLVGTAEQAGRMVQPGVARQNSMSAARRARRR